MRIKYLSRLNAAHCKVNTQHSDYNSGKLYIPALCPIQKHDGNIIQKDCNYTTDAASNEVWASVTMLRKTSAKR